MVFSSHVFLFYFLPLCLLGYQLTPVRWRNAYLTLASYVFYGWWHPWFVSLMLFSTCVDYGCGKMITAPGATAAKRKTGVWISMVTNLSLLGFFKYAVFAQENVNRILDLAGQGGFEVLEIVLPLGISFYTFQSMSYSIDLYRGQAKPARSLMDFSCYVAMFPQLVAGPIVRYRELAEQLDERPQKGELFTEGVLHFAIGFVKKVILANTMGQVADVTFGTEAMASHTAWFGMAAYMFQVYFDFSGYSDMAIGLGCMFGFRLPVNFRSPFKSQSITELWTRWHVSLSAWLRDYLYYPLGGNKLGPKRTYVNLFLTMTLGGFWHGAEWQLVVFGAAHGTLLAFERMIGKRPIYSGAPKVVRIALTWLLFLQTTVLFRAEDLPHGLGYLGVMWGGGRGDAAAAALTAGRVYTPFFVALMLLCAGISWFGRETPVVVRFCQRHLWAAIGMLGLFALAVVVLFAQAENPFIYFRF